MIGLWVTFVDRLAKACPGFLQKLPINEGSVESKFLRA
ncbi:type III secretion needle formation regulating protein [Waddlia chondrophila 2032/99]|uniref:Type III secretion needle formation regulating protein n=1 Tax=Waddlia chondrophila 2032/99 TaxID=765953 RepID=F8LF11_9BACT|nr:type III secretion needle formation regulating protein [Waddlia chondrophila 2032/99]